MMETNVQNFRFNFFKKKTFKRSIIYLMYNILHFIHGSNIN